MPTHFQASQFVPPRLHGRFARRLPLIRVLTLILLLLLPMQMRAGAADPHPHALLQLVIDVGDGTFDHHDGDYADAEHANAHAEATSVGGATDPDIATFEDSSSRLTGGMAMLVVVVTLFAVPETRSRRSRSFQPLWSGTLPVPEPPPPRTESD